MKNFNNSFFYLLLITAAILLCVRPAHASGTINVPATYYTWTLTNSIGNQTASSAAGVTFSSVAAAGSAGCAGEYYATTYGTFTSSGSLCTGSNPQAWSNVYPHTGVCPANSTGPIPTCTCNTGYIVSADGTSCVLQSTCPAGVQSGEGLYAWTSNVAPYPGINTCNGGCQSHFYGEYVSDNGLTWGLMTEYDQGHYQTLGLTCSSGPSNPPTVPSVPPSTCPTGQVLEQNAYGYICAIPGSSGSGSGTSAGSASGTPAVGTGGPGTSPGGGGGTVGGGGTGTGGSGGGGSSPSVGTGTSNCVASTNASGVTATNCSSTTVSPTLDISQLETHADALAQTGTIDTHVDAVASAVNALNDSTGAVTDLSADDLALITGASGVVGTQLGVMTTFVDTVVTAVNPPVAEPSYLREFISPFQSVACNSASWSFTTLGAGHTLTIDPCPYMPGYQNIMTWIFYIITAFGIFTMVMEVPRTTAGG